jgi:ubiquinol-cytochrome c reductase cytochrome c1 subunit
MRNTRFAPTVLAAALLLGGSVLAAAAPQRSASQAQPMRTPASAPAAPAPSIAPEKKHAPAPASAPAPEASSKPATPASAAPVSTEAFAPKQVKWSFDGPFGVFDRASLQRGFQVYKEVCSACHALSYIAFRNLGEAGGPSFPDNQVRAIAAGYKVPAEPDDQGRIVDEKGQRLTREATPADYMPPPFPNEKATRAANNGALPPDLSLIVKARAGHANYIYSIITGFGQKPPAGEKMASGMLYNPYFPGHQIAMPPPLVDGSVTYMDGTQATVDQEARDVVSFLAWASEPKMEERKRTGFNVMIFLFLLTGLLYGSYQRVWHGKH